ncbi:hypothetical protein Agub_g11172, partial [Astrephomene gubernaculifera]
MASDLKHRLEDYVAARLHSFAARFASQHAPHLPPADVHQAVQEELRAAPPRTHIELLLLTTTTTLRAGEQQQQPQHPGSCALAAPPPAQQQHRGLPPSPPPLPSSSPSQALPHAALVAGRPHPAARLPAQALPYGSQPPRQEGQQEGPECRQQGTQQGACKQH